MAVRERQDEGAHGRIVVGRQDGTGASADLASRARPLERGHHRIAQREGEGVTTALHQIGEVAERLDLSLRTIRYYEEEGLVVPSRRTDGGFRLYSEEDIERLVLIKQMKPLGFSVQEMLGLLSARDELSSGSGRGREALEQLARFAEMAKQKCSELRDRLEMAEDFSAQLRAEHRHYERRQR